MIMYNYDARRYQSSQISKHTYCYWFVHNNVKFGMKKIMRLAMFDRGFFLTNGFARKKYLKT